MSPLAEALTNSLTASAKFSKPLLVLYVFSFLPNQAFFVFLFIKGLAASLHFFSDSVKLFTRSVCCSSIICIIGSVIALVFTAVFNLLTSSANLLSSTLYSWLFIAPVIFDKVPIASSIVLFCSSVNLDTSLIAFILDIRPWTSLPTSAV